MGRNFSKEFLWSQSKRGTANFGAFLVSHGAPISKLYPSKENHFIISLEILS
jgi:hypothetical protein